jgi:hypothetical protein
VFIKQRQLNIEHGTFLVPLNLILKIGNSFIKR